MQAPVVETKPWQRLLELAQEGDQEALDAFLHTLEPHEAMRSILRLEPDEQDLVLTTMSAPEAADLVADVPDEQAADLIEHLQPPAAALIVAEMRSDEQADVVAEMHREEAEEVLRAMAPDEAIEVRALADYADDVAGGLMMTEYVGADGRASAGDVVDELDETPDDDPDHFSRYAYVVSGTGQLLGVAARKTLAAARRSIPAGSLMVDALSKRADANLDELKDFFAAHALDAVPIVDGAGRMLGVVRRSAVIDAIGERTEREMLRMRGIIGGEEVRTLPTLTRSGRRLSWLSINIVLNIIAASVIAQNLGTLDAVIALAVFLPIISDMSGASGNQAVAVSMRELSLGLVKPDETLRVWAKELSVGLINGVALGLLIGIVATIWDGNPFLGLVVGATLALNTLIAVSVGGTVPLLLKRFGVDPAVASGPILTTVTDICGFFFALTFASMLLAQLT